MKTSNNVDWLLDIIYDISGNSARELHIYVLIMWELQHIRKLVLSSFDS